MHFANKTRRKEISPPNVKCPPLQLRRSSSFHSFPLSISPRKTAAYSTRTHTLPRTIPAAQTLEAAPRLTRTCDAGHTPALCSRAGTPPSPKAPKEFALTSTLLNIQNKEGRKRGDIDAKKVSSQLEETRNKDPP